MKIIHTPPFAISLNQIEGEPGTFEGRVVRLGTVNTVGEMINPNARGDLEGATIRLLDSHNENWTTALAGALGTAAVALQIPGEVEVEHVAAAVGAVASVVAMVAHAYVQGATGNDA